MSFTEIDLSTTYHDNTYRLYQYKKTAANANRKYRWKDLYSCQRSVVIILQLTPH